MNPLLKLTNETICRNFPIMYLSSIMYSRRIGLYRHISAQHSDLCLFYFLSLMNALTWRYGINGLDNEK
jgi:hypothetical protein